MKKWKLAVVLLLFFSLASYGQQRWQAQIRPAIAFPTQDLGEAEINTGYGLGIEIAYDFAVFWQAYAGWDWNKFDSEYDSPNGNADFEETGFVLGIRFIHPVLNSRVTWDVGAGGIYKHIETENSSGEIIRDTGHDLGWEIGGGIGYELGNGFSLRPGVSYSSLKAEDDGPGNREYKLNYFSFGIGLAKRF